METPETDQRQDEQTAAEGAGQAAGDQPGPQQGEAPEPDQDEARNPADPRLNDIKGA